MKIIASLAVVLCALWFSIASPVNDATGCGSQHSDEITWQQHCDYLNKECEVKNGNVSCGNCAGGHKPDKVLEKCVAEKSCDGTGPDEIGTWKEHCTFLNRDCVPSTDVKEAECGACLDGNVEDKHSNTSRCVATKTCELTHSSGVSWKEYCVSKNNDCVPPTGTEDPKCGTCKENLAASAGDKDLCIEPHLDCNRLYSQGVTWEKHCANQNRTCTPPTATQEASCGKCIEHHQEKATKCVAKETCKEAHPNGSGTWKEFCTSKKRHCTDGIMSCGDCLPNQVQDKVDWTKCVGENSCEGTHPSTTISWQAYCDSKNRTCTASTNVTEASCGECKTGQKPNVVDSEQCVPGTPNCKDLHSEDTTWEAHCQHLKRQCVSPATSEQTVQCGNCIAGYIPDKNQDKCVAEGSCDGKGPDGVLTWKEHCQVLNRHCLGANSSTDASCGICLPGYEVDVTNNTCVLPKPEDNSCGKVDNPLNGKARDECQKSSPGSICRFDCDKNFPIKNPNAMLTCSNVDGKLQWTGEIAKCAGCSLAAQLATLVVALGLTSFLSGP